MPSAHTTGAEPHRKRACIHTLGCRLNQAESAMLVERLTSAGYDVVPFDQPADLGIIHTCTVTGEADAKSRQLIRAFIRKNPNAYTAVIGCYAQLGYKALGEIRGVDLVVGNQEKLNVLDYVRAGKNETPLIIRDRIERDEFTLEVAGEGVIPRRANLKIQDGCDFMCSFCIIPFARGRARSREFENLLDEARHLVDHGVKELVLTGVNLGTYRCDNRTLLHVIEVLSTIAGLRRIRISSIEPTTVPREILDWMADPAHPLVPYLHLPLQSGSNRVLRRMRRKYSREEYLDFITVAQDRVHDLCIGTDIMVGFPGETGSDFEDTLELLVNSPLRYAHVFRYSERWGTASTRIPGKIDPVIANRRSVLIRKASAEKRRAYYLHCLGSTVEVLFEHEENGYWTGYTGNYVRVAARSSRCLENEMRQVQLESVCGDLVVGRLGSTADDAA